MDVYIRTIISNLQVTMGFVSIVHLNNQLSKIKLDRAIFHEKSHLHLFWVWINLTSSPTLFKGGVSICFIFSVN